MSKITTFAKGKMCTVRVSQDIGCSPEDTSVLAHAPSRDDGRGYKSPDFWGAISCFNCHQLLDRQRKFAMSHSPGLGITRLGPQRDLTREEINEAWLRGIYETQAQLIEAGLIEVKE